MPEIKKSQAVMDEMRRGYVSLTKPRTGDSDVAKREKDRMRRILAGEPLESKAESYKKLRLSMRWGPL